jgi:hypothetical protein
MADTRDQSGDGAQAEGGLGQEGTIPSGSGGVGVGAGEPSNFEPEEDPEAAAADPGTPDDGGDEMGAAGHA